MLSKAALQYKNTSISYESLEYWVYRISKMYSMTEDNKIIVSLQNPIDALLVILAGIYSGSEILLLTPKSKKNTLHVVSTLYSKWKLITDTQNISFTNCETVPFEKSYSLEDAISDHPSYWEKAILHFHTSGTTGGACKFVQLRFIDCINKWKSIQSYIEFFPTDTALCVTSIYFIQTFWSVLLHLEKKATVVFDDLSSEINQQYLADHHITTITAPPSIIRGILNRVSSYPLRQVISGGDYLDKSTIHEICKKLPGVLLSNVYGCTETAAGDILFPPSPAVIYDPFIYSIGKVNYCSRAKILNEHGEPCRVGEIGELFIQNPYMIDHYYGIESPLLQDGFFPTRDLAYMDDTDHIFYMGRKKNIIISNGIKILPLEVEVCLMDSGFVKECFVVGEKDELRSEIVTAHIVPNNPLVDDCAILQFLSQRIEAYKMPKKIYRHQELHKTVTGKIIRE